MRGDFRVHTPRRILDLHAARAVARACGAPNFVIRPLNLVIVPLQIRPMDFLNKAFAQFSDLFRSMTPGSRVSAGLLLVVAVVGGGYLFQHEASGGDEYLFGGASMQTPTLQKMEEAFGKAGLNGFTMEGGRVKVPHAQRAAYLAALADHGALPPNAGQAFKAATEGGPFDLPDTSKRKFNLALQEEMSLVIGKMKGIEWASVIIDTQPQGGFAPPLKTASVAVKAIGGASLDDDQVDKIRYYVAAVGMKPENVTIADINGRIDIGRKADRGGPDSDPYNRAERKAEQVLNAKVRDVLAYIPNVTVISTVTLRTREKRQSAPDVKSDSAPAVQTTESPSTTNRESAPSGGRAEIQSQGGANQPASLSGSRDKGPNETNEEPKHEQAPTVSAQAPRRTGSIRCPSGPRFRWEFPRATTTKFGRSARDQAGRRIQEARPGGHRQDPRGDRAGRSQPGRHAAAVGARGQRPGVAGNRHDLPGHQSRCDPRFAAGAAGFDLARGELADGSDGRPDAGRPGYIAVDGARGAVRPRRPSRPRPRCGRWAPGPRSKGLPRRSKRPRPAAFAA